MVHCCGGAARILTLAGCPAQPQSAPATQTQPGSDSQAPAHAQTQMQTQTQGQPAASSCAVLSFRQYKQAHQALVDAKRRVGLDLLAKDGAIPTPVLAAARWALGYPA